jgi:hypothetical protein
MSDSKTHSHTEHKHGKDCGHTAIRHEDHIDYLHDGQLHHPHSDHCDVHVIEVNETNPNDCSPIQDCNSHIHGPDCGHESIQHGDHVDYIVNGRLHHAHKDHCDDHGPIEIIHN